MIEASTQAPAQQTDLEPIYRRNFPFFLADGILFAAAMSIISPTTIIPDFVRHLTGSEILIGLSGSLFDLGWTLPQLFIARYIIRFERKKWWFVGPNIPVRFAILIFAVITMLLGRGRPEMILLAFLICYGAAGVGDGIVGVPWADLTGTSLDERWRARLFGLMNAIVGVAMLGLAPVIGVLLGSTGPGFPNNYALLFGAAGVCFVLSIIPGLFIHELPGGRRVEKTPTFGEFMPLLGRVLRSDRSFRAVIAARLLTGLFAMASPFYVGFATVKLGLSSSVAVPTLLAMQTLGGIGGALIYTWAGARNNLLYMRLALAGGALLPISALLAGIVGPLPLYLGFLVSGLSVSNLFLSYQNWVVTHASPDERPIHAGMFNTFVAVMSLIAPIIGGTIVQHMGYEAVFGLSLLMGFGALFVMVRYVSN